MLARRETNLLDVAHAITTEGDASDRERGIVGVRPGETIIRVELGPDQNPRVIFIRRSAWPSLTNLDQGHSRGREFHLRLRRHSKTGVYLVYGSVEIGGGAIRQRGHLCRTIEEVKAVMPLLRRELEIRGRTLP